MYEIRTRELPEQKVLCLQRRVSISELFDFYDEEHTIIKQLTACGATKSGPFTVIYHGPVDEVADGPVELCVPFTGTVEPTDEMSVRVEAAHQVAYTTAVKGDVANRRNREAHEAVQQWLAAHGHVMTASPREVYFAWNAIGDDEGACDIAYPFDGGATPRVTVISPPPRQPGERR
ncbi:MAG TPA: GyrI-like domain-containing protein [Micromonosporaceae bacterium]|nr:GyrI-like domain-containing protein [Micromonosporaceae bacterium]